MATASCSLSTLTSLNSTRACRFLSCCCWINACVRAVAREQVKQESEQSIRLSLHPTLAQNKMDRELATLGVDMTATPDAGVASVQMAQANAGAVVAVLLPTAEEVIKMLVANASQLVNATLTRLPSVADETVSPLIQQISDEAHSLIWGLLNDLLKPVLCILIVAQICSTLITLFLLECGGKVLALWRAHEQSPDDKSSIVEQGIPTAAARDGDGSGEDRFVDALPCDERACDDPYCHQLPVAQPATTICLLRADSQASGRAAEAARVEQPRRQDPDASSCPQAHNFNIPPGHGAMRRAASPPFSCACPPLPPAPACLGFQNQAQGATEGSDCNQGRENENGPTSAPAAIVSGAPTKVGSFALKVAIPALYPKDVSSPAGQGGSMTSVSGAGACETGRGKRLSWGSEASRGVVQVLCARLTSAPKLISTKTSLHRRSKSSPALPCGIGTDVITDTISLLECADTGHTDSEMLPTCECGADSGALATALGLIAEAGLSLLVPCVR